MKNKKSWKISCLTLVILILSGVAIWGMLTEIDKKSLQKSLNETISFTKIRLRNYENYTANDRVKSLIRLLDKSKELSSDMKKMKPYGQKEIDDYVEEQRLSGVLISDKNQNLVFQSGEKKDRESLWKTIVAKGYIKEILEHPEETYTERMLIGNKEYDVAILPRQDAPGLLVAYAQKGGKNYGDLTLDSVFADLPVSMNGAIVVCDNHSVVSTNQAKLLGKTITMLKDNIIIHRQDNKDGIIRIKRKNNTWYGRKDKMGKYVIYVFFPSTQVFMTRSIVCGIYLAVAVLICLLLLLIRSNIEKMALKQSQKRMRIINALGTAYSSITLFDLTEQKAEVIKKSEKDDTVSEGKILSKENQKKYVNKFIAEECRKDQRNMAFVRYCSTACR